MQFSDAMRRNVHTVRAGDTLQDVARHMADEHIGLLPVVEEALVEETHIRRDVLENLGFLPVVEEEVLVGVITALDVVVRAISCGKDPGNTPVSDAMTRKFVCCHQDDDVTDALDVMENSGVRRLFVLKRERQVTGIVSRHHILAARFAVSSRDAAGN